MIYSDQYFSATGDWVEGVWQKSYVEAEQELRAEAIELLNLMPMRSGRLLEVGCAGGYFLDEARKKGFDVAGIEINQRMAAHAAMMGLPVTCGRIEEIEPEGTFDLLVLMDVLEHLPAPHGVLTSLVKWLNPNACIVIRGPICNDPVSKAKEVIRRVLWIDKQLDGYPLDVNKFTPRSLELLLREFGFSRLSWPCLTKNFAVVVAERRNLDNLGSSVRL